jgi:hypothetical protein
MAIPASQFRANFTSQTLEVWREKLNPTGFLSNFLPDRTPTATRYLQYEVQRGTEKIATDVARDSEGNTNKFDLSSQKIVNPKYFDENFVEDSLGIYRRAMGSESISASMAREAIEEATFKMATIVDKIARAYEYDRSRVLMNGIVTSVAGENLNFQRKAEMMVAYDAAHNFADDTKDPSTFLAEWGSRMRKIGKIGTGTFDLIMAADAYQAMINNAKFRATADIRRISLTEISSPVKNTEGADYMGTFSAGTCNYRIWVYDQYVEINGVLTPYIDPKKLVILPPTSIGYMGYAGVPQLVDATNPTIRTGKFLYYSYEDLRKRTRVYGVQSAGCPILLEVDKVFTAQVLS